MHSTLGLDIGAVRRQRARWPGLGGLLALAAAGFCLVLAPPVSAPLLGLIVSAAGFAAWAGWRAGVATESGRLIVDPSGNAGWIAGPGADRAPAVPVMPCRWQLGAGEIWLLAEDQHGRRLHLRLGRKNCDDGQWRAMRRWLVWSGRATSITRHT